MVRPSLTYFALVFGVGFVLGTVRVSLLVAALGERRAELLELPLMVLASFLAARWVVRRWRVPQGWRSRLPIGLAALALLLAAELLLALFLQGASPGEYVAGRDPVSGTAYALSLALFAVMPWLAPSPGRPLS